MRNAAIVAGLFTFTLATAALAEEDEKFAQHCVACHGTGLEGVEGLGVSLADSAFVGRKTVGELVAFLKVGRMPGDPESVAGRPMPGFGWLTEAELTEIATYLKSRHGP
ncbi:MAG: cytochrome c [Chromatiales bacterium]|nr:cytochrome c [Chromatiales bacterium]